MADSKADPKTDPKTDLKVEPKIEKVADVVSDDVRMRMALALDVDDAVEAIILARQLKPWFGVVKVGLELFTAAGPDTLARLIGEGFEVFLDLKLHDIPNTVNRAAKVAGSFGVKYLTLHAHGGPDMLRAGADGFLEGADLADLPAPIPLGITILTSDSTAPSHILGNRLGSAIEGGCKGVVCAAADLQQVYEIAPRMVRVVPGIRMAKGAKHDQGRPATPKEAISGGADLIVVGRAVTEAENRVKAAAAIAADVAKALAAR
jgi:orotidine-5'-phosphate decarboxylase